jgi:thiamine biosynthesis lipoprotein
LSGSGLAVKGQHILDPRTSQPATRQQRTWALCDSAAESDALSTACMVLNEAEIHETLLAEKSWLVFLEASPQVRQLGQRALPPPPENITRTNV